LARKIATIVLIVWKKGVCFDAQHLKTQTAFIGSGALCRVASVSARRSVYSSAITAHKIS
jgi:hypothetical protein